MNRCVRPMSLGPLAWKAAGRGCSILFLLVPMEALSACDSAPPSVSRVEVSKPEWPPAIELRVTGTRPAFDAHTEVLLTLENRGKTPVVIHQLETPGVAVLLRAGGSSSGIHRLSVGVAKPIALRPMETITTSLLFDAGPGDPVMLRLYDSEWRL